MQKMSLLAKCATIALLAALVLSSFPAVTVLAKGNNTNLENKWDQLVTNYNRQSINHNSAHNQVDHWFKTLKKGSSDKAEVAKHLSTCNSAIVSAGAIVSSHAGFDADGKVVDKASAQKSAKDLAYYLRQHAGSLKNLQEHMN
jgi:hypothetical protein